jgi:hypothetical protein
LNTRETSQVRRGGLAAKFIKKPFESVYVAGMQLGDRSTLQKPDLFGAEATCFEKVTSTTEKPSVGHQRTSLERAEVIRNMV